MTDTNTAILSNKVQLSRPFKTHKGEVEFIELKEPTVRSFIKAGADPFKVRTVDGATVIEYNISATVAVLSDISGIDPILIEGLPGKDFFALRDRMVYLVMLGAGDSTSPST